MYRKADDVPAKENGDTTPRDQSRRRPPRATTTSRSDDPGRTGAKPKLEAVPDLPGAVLLGQPEPIQEYPRPEELTFIDLLGLAFTKAEAYLKESELPHAKREYALAKTEIENATMRFNRARSMDLGIFHVTDTEDPAFLEPLAQFIAEAKGGEDQ
jgi:hypothetical protein